jgi:hypothetical protein
MPPGQHRSGTGKEVMRKSASRRIGSGVVAAVLTLGLTTGAVTAAGPSALASVTCHGASCVGHDPRIYGCSVSHTTEHGNGFATVWGRFSNNCDAKWARGQLTPQSLRLHRTMVVVIGADVDREFMCFPTLFPNLGESQEPCVPSPPFHYYGGSSIAFTDMVNGHLQANAAVVVYDANNNPVDTIEVSI